MVGSKGLANAQKNVLREIVVAGVPSEAGGVPVLIGGMLRLGSYKKYNFYWRLSANTTITL